MRNELTNAWRRAGTAELLWTTRDGPHGMPVVPLVWPQDRLPCAAIPLAQLREIESVPRTAALSVQTDGDNPRTLVATGRVRLEWDMLGERFIEHLLPREVAKHPPTRLRADSLMARRENWWWLPRVLVTLAEATSVCSLPPRTTADDALLVRGTRAERGGNPSLKVVTSTRWPRPGEPAPIEAWTPDGAPLDGDDEPVYVFGHRHSPDFERWERWYRSGTLRDSSLYVTAGEGAPDTSDERAGAAAPFTLPQRLLNHRRTSRACKAGIAEVERQHPDPSHA